MFFFETIIVIESKVENVPSIYASSQRRQHTYLGVTVTSRHTPISPAWHVVPTLSALATQPGSKGRILLVEFAGATSQAPRVPCVAKHLDRTDAFLSKNGGLPPCPNPCPSSASLQIQPEFNPDIPQQKKTRANRALEASPGEAESNRSR